jgi:glycosyltransferase involved in cell wall biosynthesis
MRIGLLSYEYPPETGFGGIGTYTWYQARALVKLGHQVDVISGAPEPMPLHCVEKDGVRVFRYRKDGLWMKAFRSLDRVRLWWTKNRLENAFSMLDAYQRLSRERPYDLIEMPECGAEGLLINYIKKSPAVIRFHSPSRLIMPYYDVRGSDTMVCSFLEQRGIRNATNFSACSSFVSKEATN